MIVNRVIAIAALITLIGLPVSLHAETETRPVLTASAAMKMVHGCLAKAGQEGWLMHIAIMDNSARLKAYYRMDDAQFLSQDIAMAKARTSAVSPRSTKAWSSSAFPNGGGPSAVAFVPGLNFFEGGLPIMSGDGYHLGGIGVSGDSGANDAICAQAGIAAAADELK